MLEQGYPAPAKRLNTLQLHNCSMKKTIVFRKEQVFFEKNIAQKLLDALFKNPSQDFTLSELAKETKTSKSAAYNALLRLKAAGLVNIAPLGKGGLWRIRANYEGPGFKRLKILHNLSIAFNSGVIEFLNDYFSHPKAIILFGSFRAGEDTAGSDIDFAIETAEDKKLQILRLKELEAFEAEVGRQIKLHVFNRKRIDLNLFNNIANGIVLSGFLEVNK